MEFNLQEHVKSGPMVGNTYRQAAKYVICKDGFTVSIQASYSHYCRPRNNQGPYETFELGFPSQEDEILQEYAEDSSNPTDTVYSDVPIMSVYALLYKHGGVESFKYPNA